MRRTATTFAIGLLTSAVAVMTPAAAQTVNLVCSGVMHTYENTHIQGAFAPTTIMVDLTNERISTGLGEFRIFKVDEIAIYFNVPGNLKVQGQLDRTTGHMTIFWFRPEAEAKIQAGQSATMTRYLDLNCSVAKRLF